LGLYSSKCVRLRTVPWLGRLVGFMHFLTVWPRFLTVWQYILFITIWPRLKDHSYKYPLILHNFSFKLKFTLFLLLTFVLRARVRMTWFHCWSFIHKFNIDISRSSNKVNMNGESGLWNINLYVKSVWIWDCSIQFPPSFVPSSCVLKFFWRHVKGMTNFLSPSTSIFLYFIFSFSF